MQLWHNKHNTPEPGLEERNRYAVVPGNISKVRFIFPLVFPDDSSGKETTCQSRRQRRQDFDPWVRKIPWRRK